MEDRIRDLEDYALISLELHRMAEDRRQQVIANQRQAQEDQRQAEERQRRAEERLLQMEESHQEIQELLSRLTQTVAIMQADIVRLDESR